MGGNKEEFVCSTNPFEEIYIAEDYDYDVEEYVDESTTPIGPYGYTALDAKIDREMAAARFKREMARKGILFSSGTFTQPS